MADKFTLALSEQELLERTKPDVFTPYKMLGADAPEYMALSENDKKALKHLVRASDIIDRVALRMDHHYNIQFENFLTQKIKLGDERANMTMGLFYGQRGIFGHDRNGNIVALTNDVEMRPGRAFYPYDLSVPEFHDILIDMLNNGQDAQVKEILNQRTLVRRYGAKLVAQDYTVAFQDYFRTAAACLEVAAHYASDWNFKEYLRMQSAALSNNAPLLDCRADKKWATLQSGPLEFTLGRESYDDAMTPTVLSNPKLKSMLDERGIVPYAKDTLGTTVGIIDKVGTDYLLKIKDLLPMLAQKMPRNSEYEQNITKDTKQTMVDVDIVTVGGRNAAYRGGISLAFNLPNADKLAVQTGGGYRTVYLKQMRQSKYATALPEKLNALLAPEFHKYFSVSALHDFTILHENMHSLGPKKGLESLGEYKAVIEEHKADAGSVAMLNELVHCGFFTQQRCYEIITSWLVAYLYPAANFKTAHSKRNIMQHNMFFESGAIKLDANGRLVIDFNRVMERSNKMLSDAIDIQLCRNPDMARKHIEKYAVWTPQLQTLGAKLSAVDKQRNSYIVEPLADEIRQKKR
ncbi:MAG: hypothetical protein J6J82_02760 [Alphaproteobacteria bacterium]|nr:hypothetical protein [Alphaproteobacteria bacterium]